jgi:hypothetical protein
MHDVQSDQRDDGAQPRAVRATGKVPRRQRREGDKFDIERATSGVGLSPGAGKYVS